MKNRHGRHAPAFILLIISLEPNHGLGILNKLNALVPQNRIDTSIVYRTLKDFENDGYIKSKWADSDAGPKKKVYEITSEGIKRLNTFQEDVLKSKNNLEIFLDTYKKNNK